MMICQEGTPPQAAQNGLKPAQKRQNMFLACSCLPTEDMTVVLPDQSQITSKATITDITWLAKQVYRLKVRADMDFIAGQYVTLWRDGETGRSYSIANPPNDDKEIEFHIKHIPDGAFSDWAHKLTVGDTLRIQGPMGECCYGVDDVECPLVFIGTGTGLAPLYGIIQDAIAHEHQGEMHAFIGAYNTDTLYYINELKALSSKHPQLQLHFSVLKPSDDQPDGVQTLDLDQLVLDQPLPLKQSHIYLCGAPDIIGKLRKQLFLNGASFQRIHADVFVHSAP
jgi:NAD(P)H-flavin reductase